MSIKSSSLSPRYLEPKLILPENYSNWVQPTKNKRHYPKPGLYDTVIFKKSKLGEISTFSVHTQGKQYDLFQNAEILKVHKLTVDKVFTLFNKDIVILTTETGKKVVQQYAIRSCTASASAMLVFDHGKNYPVNCLMQRNLGNSVTMIRDITCCKLKPKSTKNIKKISELSSLISKNGSGIISINSEIGGHVVVVDKIDITNKKVDLRDPWHGWSITVTLKAFTDRFQLSECIQIE